MPGKIKILEENKIGKDYIVGNVADSVGALTSAIDGLLPNDRLIISGDLFKQDTPHNIIQLISEAKKKGKHIEVLLSAREFEFVLAVDNFRAKMREFKLEFMTALGNPTVQDVIDAPKAYNGQGDAITNQQEQALKEIWQSFFEKRGDLPWLFESAVAELEKISDFFEELPCVLHVEGFISGRLFNAVSVDMPFDDEQMAYRLSKNKLELVEREVTCALFGHVPSSSHFVPITLEEGEATRAPHSVLVYRGGIAAAEKEIHSANSVNLSTDTAEILMLACHQDAKVVKQLSPVSQQGAVGRMAVDSLSALLQRANDCLRQSKAIDDQEQAKFLKAVGACTAGAAVDDLLQSRCKNIFDVAKRKKGYLGILNLVKHELSPAIRQGLAGFLKASVTNISSSQKGHFLGEERSIFGMLRSRGAAYSANTTSMKEALNFLNKEASRSLGHTAQAVGIFGGGALSSSSSQCAQCSAVVHEKEAPVPDADNVSDSSSNSSPRAGAN